jgi:molecular chaperone GrpE
MTEFASNTEAKDPSSREEQVKPKGATEAEPNELEALRGEAREWHAKADEWLDSYRRSVAEFSNYRKRIEREREQQTLRISMDLLKRLIPIMDDFERALKNVPEEANGSSWVEGITLIERKMWAILQGFQVAPIEALGQPFDPNLHSAVMQAESDTYPAGIVMEELQRGYRVADQVLRPAMVKVSSGPGAQDNHSPKEG